MKKIIFFSYDGISDPLGQSQIIPYIEFLSKNDYKFSIISYEKTSHEVSLKDINIDIFLKLKFYRGRFGKLINLFNGVVAIRRVIKKYNPDLIHLRGFIPALIFFFSQKKIKYLYDFRSFAVGEHVDTNNLKKNSLLHILFKKIDQSLIKKSSGIVVLEKFAKSLLFKTYNVPNIPIEVIRTCTDTSKYLIKHNYKYNQKEVKFVSLGGARLPYRSDLILEIVKTLNKRGFNCSIDFINKSDQQVIKNYANKISFPTNKLNIYEMNHSKVKLHLNKFDFGFIFYETSIWRSVCSPTKFGEFLSAGLPIISLEGIHVIDYYNSKYDFIYLLSKQDIKDKTFTPKLIQFIKSFKNNEICQLVAKRDFDINNANNLYKKLYEEIL